MKLWQCNIWGSNRGRTLSLVADNVWVSITDRFKLNSSKNSKFWKPYYWNKNTLYIHQIKLYRNDFKSSNKDIQNHYFMKFYLNYLYNDNQHRRNHCLWPVSIKSNQLGPICQMLRPRWIGFLFHLEQLPNNLLFVSDSLCRTWFGSLGHLDSSTKHSSFAIERIIGHSSLPNEGWFSIWAFKRIIQISLQKISKSSALTNMKME